MVDDVTVCIPTIPGREGMLFRAVESAREQARVVVNNGDGRVELAYLNWWQAIYSAHTPYVALLFDDDWYEPTFIARTRERINDEVAFVATNAIVHMQGGTRLNIDQGGMPHTWSNMDAIHGLLTMQYTISPSCVLMRREEALSCLLVGGVPCRQTPVANAGCDALMLLFLLTQRGTMEWIDEPLAHMDGGPQSTTVSEIEAGGERLLESYKIAKSFFAQIIRGGM